MTSAIAAAKYCKKAFDGASVMMIGEIGLEEALVSEGFSLTHKIRTSSSSESIEALHMKNWLHASLAIRAGAAFHSDEWRSRHFRQRRGLVPGNGSFVKLLESTTDRKPIYVGKPEPHMLHFIQQKGDIEKMK